MSEQAHSCVSSASTSFRHVPPPPLSKPLPPVQRQIITQILRLLLILLLFGLVFFWFFNEASKLSQEDDPSIDSMTTFLYDLAPDQVPGELARRRLFIKEMVRSAWSAYVNCAWGEDALEPVTCTPYTNWLGPKGGFTLLQALSTLWILELPEEFARGRSWIANNFNFTNIDRNVPVFLAVTEVLGPLLSCYALTRDSLFLNKAIEVAIALEPAYRTPTGLPLKWINPKRGLASGAEVFLGEVGGTQLEYSYLFGLTGNPAISRRLITARSALYRLGHQGGGGGASRGLYMSSLDVQTGVWSTDVSTLFSPSSPFYFDLVKAYFRSKGTDRQALEMYQEAIQTAMRHFMFNSSIAELQYARDYYQMTTVEEAGSAHKYSNNFGDFMLHDGCYLGGMFALGAMALEEQLPRRGTSGSQLRKAQNEVRMHRELAVNLTETCRFSCLTKTGLPPNYLFVNDPEKIQSLSYFNEYHLSPELPESYLILYRTTANTHYRDWSWQLALAIHRHTRSESSGGYSNIADVEVMPSQSINYMPPHLLGATMKYLYLIFTEAEAILPLGSWIFTRSGQPLPSCGASSCR